MNNQELEVKFFIANLALVEERLKTCGAEIAQPRVHEVNLRFDTADGELKRTYQVLRLRQDRAAIVTYKGPGRIEGGVRARQEIEFTVSDYEAAKALFEALGFQVSLIYEKYRTTYLLGQTHVVLDEMPYGSFIEIEGPDPGSIQETCHRLGLDWERRILESYTFLFEQLKARVGLDFRDLTFENFSGQQVTPQDLAVSPADL